MRNQLIIVAGLLLTGCSTERPAMQARNTTPPVYHTSAALAFDAPITFSEPLVEVSRADRGAAAFWGYDEGSTTSYDILSYDRQSSDRGDRYVQDSYSEKTGSMQR